jgi:phage baseplate assembly protein W
MQYKPDLKKFKDVDLGFGKNDLTNDLKTRNGLPSISQSIKNIVLTSPGERPFSDFGFGIYAYFWENDTVDTFIAMKTKIASAINLYEPRVKVNSNDITIIKKAGNSIEINIRYRLSEDLTQTTTQNLSIVVTEA